MASEKTWYAGLSKNIRSIIEDNDLTDPADVLEMDLDELEEIPGIGSLTAGQILSAAQSYLDAVDEVDGDEESMDEDDELEEMDDEEEVEEVVEEVQLPTLELHMRRRLEMLRARVRAADVTETERAVLQARLSEVEAIDRLLKNS